MNYKYIIPGIIVFAGVVCYYFVSRIPSVNCVASYEIANTSSVPYGDIAFAIDGNIATKHPAGLSIELRNVDTGKVSKNLECPIAIRCFYHFGNDILVIGFGSFCVLNMSGTSSEIVPCNGIHTRGLLANNNKDIFIPTYNSGKIMHYKNAAGKIEFVDTIDIIGIASDAGSAIDPGANITIDTAFVDKDGIVLIVSKFIMRYNQSTGAISLIATLPGRASSKYIKYSPIHDSLIVISDYISVVKIRTGVIVFNFINDMLATAATLNSDGQSLIVCCSRPSISIPFTHHAGYVFEYSSNNTCSGKWKTTATHIWDIYIISNNMYIITDVNLCEIKPII